MSDSVAYTDAMNRLIEEFMRMPGIGRKTAEKLAYHVVRSPKEGLERLANALREVSTSVISCSVCHALTETDPCSICQDESRDRKTICVVEQPKDLIALEKTGAYRGLYHVLTGRVSPLEGIGPQDLTIESLRERVERAAKSGEPVTEVILATNPDYEGDGTALYVREALAGLGVNLTALARGIPAGGSIEFASAAILTDALRGRRVAEDPVDKPSTDN